MILLNHFSIRVKTISVFTCCLGFLCQLHTQPITPQKDLPAQRLTGVIKIDGILNEDAWKTAPVAKDFIEWRPNAGQVERAETRTEVYFLYDNTSIYIGGYCHEPSADSIAKELVGRDVIGSNDFVGVIFDTYNDKINASGFYVTPLSEQFDAKYSNSGNEDGNWNAVWFSEAKIVADGWTFEMRIPYSALRFSKQGTVWGLNITRKRGKSGKQYMWNPVSPTITGFISQEGLWTGISNIEPPLRLAFTPYFSAYLNHYPYNTAGMKNTSHSINGGMDLKYGINQNLTLDMTLIPDFGQVQSDKKVLNLSPFEIQYDEKRQFFTEGTELFSKGNLFYSRRIGGEPLHKNDVKNQLDTNETILDNPTETKLLNATKISGRTRTGLGLGFFNAITKPMYALVENDSTHEKREIQTSPLSNYNIMVLDQTLKNNSSLSLINTNVCRNSSDYDANVTSGMFDIYTKGSVYNYYGQVKVSQLMRVAGNTVGYAHNFGFAKTGGRFNFNFYHDLEDDKYEINDMGILFANNELEHYVYFGYKWIKPGSWYNNLYLNFNNNLAHRFSDKAYQSFNNNVNINGQLKNLWNVGAFLGYSAEENDFYEPRKKGRVFKTGQVITMEVWGASNPAKKYWSDAAFIVNYKDLLAGRTFYLGWGQRYKFNDKFSLSTNFTFTIAQNDVGYASLDTINNDPFIFDIIFSKRTRNTSENTLSGKYNFSKKSGINIIVRHYWSQVAVNQYYTLQNSGYLITNNSYTVNNNQNLNLFNVDLSYIWEFAPGSSVSIVWKNAISDTSKEVIDTYFGNLRSTFDALQNNNVSLKILYYLDYLSLKKKRS